MAKRKLIEPEQLPWTMKVKPLTKNQANYFKEVDRNVITFVAGKAGTGKTYIAVAKAIKFLEQGLVDKIILTRPIKEVGNSIGYLPGTVEEKISVYLIPLLDVFNELVGSQQTKKWITEETVQLFPLNFMRGLSRKKVFYILDEAQNADLVQLRMFLTRISSDCRMIVTGDPQQRDIHENAFSYCMSKLSDVDGIGCVKLTDEDIVRHPLVGLILDRIGE